MGMPIYRPCMANNSAGTKLGATSIARGDFPLPVPPYGEPHVLPTRTGKSAHRDGPRRDCSVSCTTGNSSGPLLPMDNRGPFDIATLAIFPEYVEFDAQDVLRFVVAGAAGRTIK